MFKGGMVPREINLEEKRIHTPTTMVEQPYFSIPVAAAPAPQTAVATPAVGTSTPVAVSEEAAPTIPVVVRTPAATSESVEEPSLEPTAEPQQPPLIETQVAQEPLRRSSRARRSAIPDDYEVYTSKEVTIEGDPTSFEEAMKGPNSFEWLTAMEDEMRSMSPNKVWDLEEIPKGAKTVGCKWVYKTKRDSNGNLERFKARLVAKGFT